jgi:hypothetical protein
MSAPASIRLRTNQNSANYITYGPGWPLRKRCRSVRGGRWREDRFTPGLFQIAIPPHAAVRLAQSAPKASRVSLTTAVLGGARGAFVRHALDWASPAVIYTLSCHPQAVDEANAHANGSKLTPGLVSASL